MRLASEMFNRPGNPTDALKAVLAASAAIQAKADRLRAARAKASEAILDCDTRVRQASEALEAARHAAAADAAEALADGRGAAPVAGLQRLRNEIAQAEDAKIVAAGAYDRLSDQIEATEAELSALSVRDALREAMAPKVRILLDKAYEARSTLDQTTAQLSLLFNKRLSPSEMDIEIGTALGFHYTSAPGGPGSKTRAPDIRALEAALADLHGNPEGVLSAL